MDDRCRVPPRKGARHECPDHPARRRTRRRPRHRGRCPRGRRHLALDRLRPVAEIRQIHRPHPRLRAGAAGLAGFRQRQVQACCRRPGHRRLCEEGRGIHLRQARLRGDVLRAGHRPVWHAARSAVALESARRHHQRPAGHLCGAAAGGHQHRRQGEDRRRLSPPGRRHRGMGKDARAHPGGRGRLRSLRLVQEMVRCARVSTRSRSRASASMR